MRSLLISLFLLINSSIFIYGQNKFSDDLKLEISGHAGFILPEYQFLNAITKDYIRSIDVCITKETKGKTYWEQLYKLPEYGLSFFYSSLGNNDVLGHEFALTYFFKLNYISKQKFKFYQRVGIGGGYITKRFNLTDNYLNVAVGSKLNVHFNTRFGVEFRISPKINFNLGLSFDHFSNANTNEPNLGINYITAFSGISYRLGKENTAKHYDLPKFEKPTRLDLFFSIGGKHPRSLTSNYYLASSISLDYTKAITRAIKLSIGPDLFYDSSVKSQLSDFNRNYKPSYSFQTGIHFAQEFTFNRFSVILQEGVYIGLTERVDRYPIYNRGIVKFQLNDKLAIRITMKSHLHILDYPEFGIGYKL